MDGPAPLIADLASFSEVSDPIHRQWVCGRRQHARGVGVVACRSLIRADSWGVVVPGDADGALSVARTGVG